MRKLFFLVALASLLSQSLAAEDLASLKEKFPARFHRAVKLTGGETHYELKGKGPLVVLVHGVSGPMHVWDKTVPFLVSKGYRVLRLDLYGRGFSDRLAPSENTLANYVKQVGDLLVALDIEGPLVIVGSSFGAIVSTEFALKRPVRVKGVILVGPAGFPIQMPFLGRLRDIPILGNLLFKVAGRKTILDQNRKYFTDLKPPADFWEYFSAQLDVPGSKESILATMRNAPVQNYVESYGKLGATKIPVAVIWGKKDVTFPYDNNEVLLKEIPRAKLFSIDGAAHLPQYETADEANADLLKSLEFLKFK